MTTKKRVLWVDDDKIKDRLIYFEMVITEDLDWDLDVATCLEEAAEKLASGTKYDAIILDQQFPLKPVHKNESHLYTPQDQDIWLGTVLLFWLSGSDPEWLRSKPVENMRAYEHIKRNFKSPSNGNEKIPIMILSVLEQDEIKNACDNIVTSNNTSTTLDIIIKSKPVRENLITRFLSNIRDS